MKRFLCGWLVGCLVFPNSMVFAQEAPANPIAEPVVAPTVEPVLEQVVETIEEPVTEPIAEQTEIPVVDPISVPMEAPTPEPLVEPAIEPIAEPITEPSVESVVEPVAEPIVEPIVEPVLEPALEPIAPPVDPPIGPPAGSPIGSPIGDLIINEVMTGTEISSDKDAWVEIYNPTDREILLDGWTMNGVTAGGSWVEIADGPGRAIQPKSHFLISHYTNSKSSALAVKPQVQKTSLLFPNPLIQIELRDPSGSAADRVEIEKSGADYRSFERKLPATDGTLAESWDRSTMQTNLKAGLTQTFGTPGAENSFSQPIGEVETLACSENGSDLMLNWINPASPNLASLNIYQLNAVGDGWDLIANIQPVENWPIPNSSASTNAFKITTLDRLGRESVGSEVEWAPKPKMRINEVLPKPKLREAENEFIELWNFGSTPVDLRGWELDNGNLEDDFSYLLVDEGRDYVVQPNAGLAIYSNETLISLGNLGESVYLFDSEGNEIGHYDFAPLLVGRSWGRRPENPEEWFALGHPTPGAPNVDVNHAPIASIKAQGGARELTINITGEDSMDPDGDKMDFTWVFEPGATDNRKNPTSYAYGAIGLKTITLTVTDEFGLSTTAQMAFDAQIESGGGRDESNPAPAVLKSYNAGDLVIESVLPNPNGTDADSERITLKNSRREMIVLQGWKIENLKGKRFALKNASIPAMGRWALHPSDIQLSLVNKADRLTLIDPAGNRIDSIEWSQSGSGQTLFRPSFLEDGIRAEVTSVVDGDTFRARIEGLPITVRLLGVDTPETVHPFKDVEKFGREASDYLKNRLNGKTVALSFEPQKTDKYGRLLAYVNLEGAFINSELIQKGIGIAYTRFPFKYLEEFKALGEVAKQNKVGLWAEPLTLQWVEDSENSEETTLETEQPLVLDEKEPKPKEEEVKKPVEEEKPEPLAPLCPGLGLKIDSILPNPRKGETVEFIRIVNLSDETICLNGWSLDDQIDGGSKPHEFKGGSLAPGAMRTFRKTETKLSLNNQNDCATLINPVGEIADQLCYGKTHPNEQFTHAGGDWKPKVRKGVAKRKKAVAVVSGARSRAQPAPQPFSEYLKSLTTESLTGRIKTIDPEKKLFYFESANQTLPISFAHSAIDISMVAQMTDVANPVIIDVRGGGTMKELISLRLLEGKPVPQKRGSQAIEWELGLMLLILVGTALGLRMKSSKVD